MKERERRETTDSKRVLFLSFALSSRSSPHPVSVSFSFPRESFLGRPNETCRRELAIWRLSGLSSPIPAASEAIAHAVGSLCLFTVIRYSFSGHQLIDNFS